MPGDNYRAICRCCLGRSRTKETEIASRAYRRRVLASGRSSKRSKLSWLMVSKIWSHGNAVLLCCFVKFIQIHTMVRYIFAGPPSLIVSIG